MRLNTWPDLHGECDEELILKKSRDAKWCDNCQCFTERADMKRWSPDGTFTYFLCPGCDAFLDEPELNDE